MRLIFLLFVLCPVALAQKTSSVVRLVADVTTVAPGEPFTMALELKHPDEWHSYYKNSGGVELPPRIEWELPEGAKAGPIQWPTPTVKEGFAGKSFIYEGSPVFLVNITPPTSITPGETFKFSAMAKWQICKMSCIDEEAEFSFKIPIGKTPVASEETKLFTTARDAIPSSPPPSVKINAFSEKDSPNAVKLQISGLREAPDDFVPNEPYLSPLSENGEISETENGYLLALQRKKIDFLDQPIPQGNSISGIIISEKPFVVAETPISSPTPEDVSVSKLLPILGGMFIGGLILNLMPCVFPVIGLKIMGFVQQAGENRRSIALHGASFTLGVIASFGVLSGILFAFRKAALESGGDAVGWGYQLQNPIVVLVLLLLMFLLGLNMFGVFEIGTAATSVGGNLQNKSGHSGSFFSGVLATVVATPCSAPFLGAAIGATMALPAFQFFSGFTAMALGLATPYLVLSLFPALVEKLPRPGAWMESFKQGMSFLLFATAGYLLWVYSGLIGQENLLAPLIGLSLIAAGTWIYGRWYLPHRSKSTKLTSMVLATGFALTGIALSLPPEPEETWQTWSEEKVNELLSEGTPVYVDFTAQWCLTCQVNKKIAYTENVLSLARVKKIVFLKADKTRPNPAIDAKLTELGRSAIPVNVLYIPGEEPIVTPEVLTPGILTDLFNKIPKD